MKIPLKNSSLVMLLWLSVCRFGDAQQTPPAGYNELPKHAAKAKAAYRTNLAKFKHVDHVLVLPGLVADRKIKRIELFAEATGIRPETIVEFLLIDAASSKGYEALLWSHAKPSDIHRALEFIGMSPGERFHPGKLQFWPKGERVLASVGVADGGERIPLESLIFDKTTGQSLPATGFVFTGSMTVSKPGMPDKKSYAADVIDPKSVVSIFNDATSVLDVPRRAPQNAVYGKQLVAPAYQFEKHQPLTVTLEPEYKDGKKRVVDLSLRVKPTSDAASKLPAAFELSDLSGKAVTEREELADVLSALGRLKRDGRDPFVSVRFDSEMKLGVVQQVCRLIQAIDTERGIRVEPPADGQLYYEAFLPRPQLLDRDTRIVDPWEVHLSLDESARQHAKLVQHKSRFVDGKRAETVTSKNVSNGKGLRMHLDTEAAQRKKEGRRPGPRVLLVFGDAELKYRPLVEFLKSAMSTHNVIHVFLDADPVERE